MSEFENLAQMVGKIVEYPFTKLILFSDKKPLAVYTMDENATYFDLKLKLVSDIYFRTVHQTLYHINKDDEKQELLLTTKIKDLEKFIGDYTFELVIPENYKLTEAKAKKDCNRLYCFCKPYETTGKKCTKLPHLIAI